MLNLSQIIKNPISDDIITQMYLSKSIPKNEMYLLMACKNEYYLRRFLIGSGEYKLKYKELDGDFYFTNKEMVLSAFYSLYKKYPNYNFDQVLRYAFNTFSKDPTIIYQIITMIHEQLENEIKGVSPFRIVDIEMLKNCKISLQKVKEVYKGIKKYEALNKENGYMDVLNELNIDFKKNFNYDIINDNVKSF